MKFLLMSLFIGLMVFVNVLNAKIIKIESIEQIQPEINPNTLVLFNIAEVLMDTETSLGTQAWRKYVRSHADSKTHDYLTLFVFENVPPKLPESRMAELVQQLQQEHIPVFAFTSRGRHEWYKSQIPNIDLLTEKQMKSIGIDLSKTEIPPQLEKLNTTFSDFFHDGIIYTTNTLDKGELLEKIFNETGYRPKKIVFVDDKADSLESVEEMANKFGIEFVGFAYSKTAKDHKNFDLMIANIQLDWLLTHNEVLTDEQAKTLKEEKFSNVDPDTYFSQLMEKWNASK